MNHVVQILTSKTVQYLAGTFCLIMLINKLTETYKDYYEYQHGRLK